MLGFVAGWHVGRLSDQAWTGALAGSATGLLAGRGLDPVSRPRRGGPVAAPPAVWTGPLVATAGLAAAAWLAGSTGGPWCDPDAWWQPHALWHVLTALLVLAWAARAARAGNTA